MSTSTALGKRVVLACTTGQPRFGMPSTVAYDLHSSCSGQQAVRLRMMVWLLLGLTAKIAPPDAFEQDDADQGSALHPGLAN